MRWLLSASLYLMRSSSNLRTTETSFLHRDDAEYSSDFSLDLVIKFNTNFIVSVFVLHIIKYDFQTLFRLKLPRRSEHRTTLTII